MPTQSRGHGTPRLGRILHTKFYAPIVYLMDRSDRVYAVVQWYCHLWHVIVNGI